MHSIPRRRLLGATLAVATGLVLTPQPVQAETATTTLTIPAPTGPHNVGASVLHLTDTSRTDPWVPTEVVRELMVTVFYPTTVDQGATLPFQTPAESAAFIAGKRVEQYFWPGSLSDIATHAYLDARPAGRPRSRPLVVLSPGFTGQRSSMTSLAEDLASHGYIVATIDHNHETYGVEFPDGSITTCAACTQDDNPDEFFPKLFRAHSADVSFVLDRLTGANPAWSGSRLIDASRIGMSGHSAGGAAALVAMRDDSRIDAGVNMDGSTYEQLAGGGLNRPFLFLGQEAEHSPGQRADWDNDYARLTGWRRWITVAGVGHASFADYHALADQVGLDGGATTSGARAIEITRAYNRAMFDRHLRGVPQPLLQTASSCYPEALIAAK